MVFLGSGIIKLFSVYIPTSASLVAINSPIFLIDDFKTSETIDRVITLLVVYPLSISIFLSLSSFAGEIAEYRIYLLLPLKNETVYRGVNRNFVVDKLTPASDYKVRLQACTAAGCTLGDVQQFR